VVVGGMFIGPIVLLIVVPALMTLFLDRRNGASPAPASGSESP
jgi:heavy metal efflux system protein